MLRSPAYSRNEREKRSRVVQKIFQTFLCTVKELREVSSLSGPQHAGGRWVSPFCVIAWDFCPTFSLCLKSFLTFLCSNYLYC